ncbi:MAG: B12-binding domain-containing radical SAM protein, partial [Deltaproteobacteria bacterium]|nr:B12-binding domain-containing radical SAM protein [Deltaproteobacteria bacterium]
TRKKYGSGHFFKEHIEKPTILKEIPRKYSRYGITPELFEQELMKVPKPDVILITSMMTYWYPGVSKTITLIKEHYPDTPVILGGIYTTLCPDHASKYSGADYYICGEGEESVLKKIGEITNRTASFMPNLKELDTLPYPAFDLMSHHDSLCILTSRGCPYRCTYCASPNLNNGFRQRGVSNILDEILYWTGSYPVKEFVFYDDALLYKAGERFVPLFKEIIKRDIKCNFHTPNGLHVKGITKKVSELLFQAGFKTIRLGFETVDKNKQIQTGGKTNNKEFEQAVKHMRQAGYESEDIGVYLLVGLPGQGAEEVRRSIRFVVDCGAHPFLAEYSPIPGTSLWEDALKASPFNLDEDPLFHNNSILPCRSDKLSWEHLYQLKNEVKG